MSDATSGLPELPPEPKSWIAKWPYDLQPIPGSSGLDWTTVVVVPKSHYDAEHRVALAYLDTLHDMIDRLEFAQETAEAGDVYGAMNVVKVAVEVIGRLPALPEEEK